VEWWDKMLLPYESYNDIEKEKLKLDEVTIYVEHPIPLKPPGEKDELAPLPIYLTIKERKKLRRRNRIEREKERQERVLLGLEDFPKPKVKISNLMRVLGAEATSDPTQIEQEVRRQMAERVANHEARNQSRKLSKEEKKEKKKQKMENDAKKGIHVALFRVNDISDPRHKFKVDVNARDLQVSGCVILYNNVNLVVVEGGEKAIRKFKKLMLKRIDWSKSISDENSEDPKTEAETEKSESKAISTTVPGVPNKCVLVWEGTILKANFQQFRFESFPNEEAIRKYLNHRWSEHYLDMCVNFKEPELNL